MFIRNKVPCFKQATRVLCPDPKSKFTPWKYTTNLSVGLLRYYASITSNITQMAEVVKLNCKYNSYVIPFKITKYLAFMIANTKKSTMQSASRDELEVKTSWKRFPIISTSLCWCGNC